MSDVTLSSAVRTNLLSLQNTADMMSTTQNRLATGKKVNSALDNPTNFFTSSGLNSRAGDMNALLDGMANGIQTLEAADNGLTAITKTLESMQSTLRQARQDKSFETASYTIADDASFAAGETIDFSGGAVGDTAVEVNLTKGAAGSQTGAGTFAAMQFDEGGDSLSFDVAVDGGTATSISIAQADVQAVGNGDDTIDDVDEFAAVVQAKLDAAGLEATASNDGGNLAITSNSVGTDSSIAVTNLAVANGGTNDIATTDSGLDTLTTVAGAVDGGETKTVDELVSEINNNATLNGAIRASNDNGKLRIENQSTQDLSVDGVSADGAIDGTSSDANTIEGNTVRAGLADQFNELRDQLDKIADDASFNGINLLRGDNLQITFNETGTSEINIQTEGGETINSGNLGVPTTLEASDLDSDTNIDNVLADVKTAINEVRAQSSSFGSNLSVVENRQNFTKNMINTLETGASNLTLADANEEAANLLALQTRQQLSSTALSMASQADQAVLRLF
ncbi:flagellin [Pelagibacterium nitratireducens]|uniref:Flagellin n=1 Tax=Pelagibacterium nitratireducens TaxID=1046114 RepID=A0ABZ2I936_9HYPH